MTEYREMLERELERLTPPRIPVDRLVHRRDRKRRNQRVTAGIVATAVSMLAIGGLIKAFSGPPPTGDDRSLPAPSVTALSYVDVASGEVTSLPRPITGIVGLSNVSVSPDGSSIAFVGKRSVGERMQVFIANADGSDVRQLTTDEAVEATHPSWSSDGTQVVYEGDVGGDVDLFIVDVTSGAIRRLTEGLTPTPLVGVSPTPRFAPDGQTIIFTRTAPGSVQLWRVSAAGGGHPSLLRSGAGLGAFSPDGRHLAFRYATADASVLTLGGIFIGDPDGSNAEPLENAGTGSGGFIFWNLSEVSASAPQWSPDGTRLLVLHYYSRSGPVPVRMMNVATKDATRLGRAQEAAWLDDDTLIVRGFEPLGSTAPFPSRSVTPASDVERVGFLGLAPRGSLPSLPAVGELMISFHYFCCPGRSLYVYADGRMIWSQFNIVGPGKEGYFPLAPEGANDDETGYLEQRLTREGVELLRSELISSGLFEEDHSFVKKGEELTIGVRRADRMVTLHAAKADDPFGATEEQARAILRLSERFSTLESWLPEDAWADRVIRAFVPSRYIVTIHFYSNGGRTPDDPSELPPPADELLRSADVVSRSSSCQVVSFTEARRIHAVFMDAFGDLSIPYGFLGTPVTILSALPDQTDCASAGWV